MTLSSDQRRRMCSGKRRYPSEARAMNTAIRALHREQATGLRVYRCPVCDGYHLTSRLRPEGRREA